MASSRSVKAGRAYVEFFLEDNPLRRGLTLAERRMRQFGASIQNIGRKAFTAGLAGVASMALPMSQMMAFDDAIRMTGAVSQSSAEQLESLRQTALELGRTTSFTAVEVASLMGELGRAGFKPDEINAMTAAVLNLSRASGTDAVLASGIMAATLRQFSMGAGEATRVANVLTLAANSTFNSVESLGEALSYAGPVAADLGMTLEDTVAILGTLGNVGIQGSNAGTALRRITTMTAAEAEKMKEIFGVSFLDAAGNVRPLITVMGELAQSTNGLPTGERIAKMNEAFGLLGITGASVMAKAAANTTDLANSLRQAGSVAADTAANMDAGPGGTWRILTSAVEGASIAIGTALSPQFMKLGAWVTETTGKLTTFITQNEGLIVSAAKAAGYMLAAGTALILLGKGLQVAAIGATILNAGLGVVSIGVSILSGVLGAGATLVGLAATAWTMLSAATASGTIAYSLATGAVAAFQIAVLALTSTETLAAIATTAMEVATIAGSVAYSLATFAITSLEIGMIALVAASGLATVGMYAMAAASSIWTTAASVASVTFGTLSGVLGLTTVMTAAMEAATIAGSVAYSLATAAVAGLQIGMLSLASGQALTTVATYGLAAATGVCNAAISLASVGYGIASGGLSAFAVASGIMTAATATCSMVHVAASAVMVGFNAALIAVASSTSIAAMASAALEAVIIAGSVAYSLATAAIAGVQIALITLASGQAVATAAAYGLAAAHAIANAVLTGGAIAYSMITWAVSMFQVAMLTLASAEGFTAVATTVLSGALSALGAVLVFMTSPVGIIIAGIIAIGAAAGMIGNPITALTGMLGGAAAAFSGMAGQIMETASMLMDVYKPAWDLIVGMIGSGDIAGAMTFAWELAKASFSLGIAYIMQAWGEFSDWLSGSVSSVGLTIGEIWGAMWDNFIGVAQYAWAAIKDTLNAVVDFGRSLVGATKIDRKSNVDQVKKDMNARQDARAQESFDARAKLEQQQKSGEGARQAAVDAQLAKINELISTEKARTDAVAAAPPAAPVALPPQQQALAQTLANGTAAAMTARAEAITAVDKNSAEGQKAIYESLDQSGKKDETVGAIGSLEDTLVDQFERDRRDNATAPRLAGSRKS